VVADIPAILPKAHGVRKLYAQYIISVGSRIKL